MFRGLGRDRRGTVTVIVALMSSVIFAVTAIALDLVTIYIARRNAQGAADLAAILAAAGPGLPDAIARRSLSDNGFDRDLPSARVTAGTYTAQASLPVDGRFAPGSSGNAVRVAFSTHVRMTFARIIGLDPNVDVAVSAMARRADFAAFTVGSGLLSLDGGIANALLRSLLGANVSLNVMDYNALASAKVDAFRYLDALAVAADLTVADYDQILAADVTLTQALSALSASLPGGSASQAVGLLARSLGIAGSPVPVASLVELGEVPAPHRPARTAGPALNALAALTNAVVLANGGRQVSIDLGPSIPGLLRTKLLVAIGQRKQSSGFVSPESALGTVRTGQMRLLLEATLALPLGTVTLPIYVEAAKATATLATVTCPWSDPSRREVAIDVRPGVVDLAIASVPATAVDLARPSPPLTIPAPLLSLPLVTVRGQARATWEAPYAQRLTFSNDDIATGRVRSVSSRDATTSIVGSLLSGLRLDVNGIDLTAILDLQRSLRPALMAVAAPLDTVLDTTLRMLGIRLGFADVVVDGTRCERAVLVQ